MVSQAAVFRDIVPGYRVRLPTDKELTMPVSKDVRRVRDTEAALLRAYQARPSSFFSPGYVRTRWPESKDVRRLRDTEAALLRAYRARSSASFLPAHLQMLCRVHELLGVPTRRAASLPGVHTRAEVGWPRCLLMALQGQQCFV